MPAKENTPGPIPPARGRRKSRAADEPATAPSDDLGVLPIAITAAEAAHHLGVTVPALTQMRQRGDGPVFIRYGRAIRYLPEDIRSWWMSNRVEPDAPNPRHQW